MKALPVAAASVVVAMLAAGPAWAQSGVSLDTQVSARQVEAGRPFRLQLTATTQSGDASPGQPRLTVPRGITAQGPSVATQQQVRIVGSSVVRSSGITATWLLVGARPGTYSIGPASVAVGGRRHSGNTVSVEIVPAGAGTPPSPSRRPSPFDPFGSFPSFPQLPSLPGFGDPADDADRLDLLPPYPDELRVDRAPEKVAFLRATITPERAVVGEQMTLRVYAYGARGPFREADTNEPSRKDFVSYPIVENAYGRRLHQVPIDGEVWHAVKIREIALFPLRAGTLEVGPMQMGFQGRRYPSRGRRKGFRRKSQPLEVVVTEPPMQNRPVGYRLGDVGRFELTASVQPREVTAGEAVSVVVTLKGQGHLPYDLRTPQQRGVEWLKPTVVDDLEVSATAFSGWRKFTYVVRLDRSGQIELGEIALPYWDPSARAYAVARTGLGAVAVKPGSGSGAEPASAPTDVLEALSRPRAAFGPAAVAPWRPADRPWFWGLLLVGPALVLTARGGVWLGAALRDRWHERRQAHETLWNRALKEAQRAADQGDAAAAASAAERAALLALERATGLKPRAILREELPGRLSEAGLSAELVEETGALLEAFDAVRFTGAVGDVAPQELVQRTRRLVGQLARRSSGKGAA